MAKNKKSKASEKENFEYSVELTGLILILIGLINVLCKIIFNKGVNIE